MSRVKEFGLHFIILALFFDGSTYFYVGLLGSKIFVFQFAYRLHHLSETLVF